MLITNGTLHRGLILEYNTQDQTGTVQVFLFEDPLVVTNKMFEACVCEEGLVPCRDLYVWVVLRDSRVVFMQQEV